MVKAQGALTGAQLRAARALLRLTAERLASETGVSLRTISRAERSDGHTALTVPNEARILEALERRGVVFVVGENGGPGVRLRLDPSPLFGSD